MKSLNTMIKDVRDALLTVNTTVRHYTRMDSPPFLVWAEDAEDTGFSADNRKSEQRIHGTADYFTQTEYDPIIDDIQDALDDASNISFQLSTVQYEEETKIIHYTWDWWVY